MSEFATKKEIYTGLAKALRDALVKNEARLKEAAEREAVGSVKMKKNAVTGYGPKAAGVGSQQPGPIAKEEVDPSGDGCPSCGESGSDHLGPISGRNHFLCKGCGVSFSTPREENEEAQEDAEVSKKEIDQVEAAEERPAKGTVLPNDKKSKKLDPGGSGGDVEPGSLRKDALTPAKSGQVKLPGMTKPLPKGVAPGTHPEVAEGLRQIHEMHSSGQSEAKAKTPEASKTVPFVKKPSVDTSVPPPTPEKSSAGKGFLSNLLSKYHGRRAMPARMALSEETLAKEAIPPGDPRRTANLPSLKGAKYIASNPTAMPSFPGLKPKDKASSAMKAMPKEDKKSKK